MFIIIIIILLTPTGEAFNSQLENGSSSSNLFHLTVLGNHGRNHAESSIAKGDR